MLAGLVAAIAANFGFYNWIFAKHWSWAETFPLGWIGIGLTYMSTFFHELGHTVFAWMYGYPTLPMFDFQHGGGFAWSFTGQQYVLIILFYGILAYGLYYFRARKYMVSFISGIFIFHLFTAYSLLHQDVINFMGPGAEPLIASFFLYRALFDLASRGVVERFLNAAFGFAMIFHVFIESWALLYTKAYRLVYYEQKGTHGFGDFDKIAWHIDFLSFESVVVIWAGLGVLCLLLPFVLFFIALSPQE